jgi:hypothetical protein
MHFNIHQSSWKNVIYLTDRVINENNVRATVNMKMLIRNKKLRSTINIIIDLFLNYYNKKRVLLKDICL